MIIYLQKIDRKIKNIILNPTMEDMQRLGSECDDRCNYVNLSTQPIGLTNPDLIILLGVAIKRYSEDVARYDITDEYPTNWFSYEELENEVYENEQNNIC